MDIIKLNAAGINYAEGLKRFANKRELYEKYLVKFFEDPSFFKLGGELAEKNYAEAFQSAHTLKGISGNLSMTDLFQGICGVVEALRREDTEHVDAMYQALMPIYERAKNAVC